MQNKKEDKVKENKEAEIKSQKDAESRSNEDNEAADTAASNEKRKVNISLRFFIVVTVSSLLLAALIAFTILSAKACYKDEVKGLKQDLHSQCVLIADNILNTNSNSYGSKMKAQIESVAEFFGGRVLIIGNDYEILLDSKDERIGSYIICDNVIDVFTGETTENLVDTEGGIEYLYPVMDGSEIKAVVLIDTTYEKAEDSYKLVILSNTIVAAIIFVIGIIIAFAIAFKATQGVKRVNELIENARDGHVENSIPEEGFSEFQMLTENYNKTISKLMQIDSSRQEFVSNVSHELKTPITSMKVLADSLVENESADLAMYKDFMTDIVAEIDRESQIITDLLTLVKTDKNSAKLELKETDINELLEIIIKRVTPLAQTRNIEIKYEKYRDVTANVDGGKLTLALSNIIENAVKYNIDNGWIKVTLNADHKYFHIKVADSGVGIPDDCKDKVFERFYRVDKARSRDTGGTGLGLAITNNIVRMHEGSIKLYSESGAGTTFTIKIPIGIA